MYLDINWEEESIPEEERDELRDLLKKGISTTLQHLGGPEEAEVSLTLVDDSRIHQLNKEYRGVDSPTDVLSFALQEEIEDEPEILDYEDDLLGDIVISVERARAQALEYEHSFERELVYLAVHGTLHLLGYDHLEDEEKAEMRELEEAVMEKIGLPRV
ncbi:MAG: rRNA maturation RNase YbeY [Desulfitobacterium sp.]|nr:rRNA maturation RNase YbeY [Desulfitobacterium sp.]